MENAAKIIAIISGIINIFAYVIYSKDIVAGKIKPNLASWSLWFVISVLNTATYGIMTDDWVKSLLTTLNTAIFFLTFVLALRFGWRGKIGRFDLSVLLLGLVSCGIWWLGNSVSVANLFLQIPNIMGYLPTYRSVQNNPSNENALPWAMWGLVFGLGFVVVAMKWSGNFVELVYPAVGCILSIGVSLVVICRKARVSLN